MKRIIAILLVIGLFSTAVYGASTLKSISVAPNYAAVKVDGKLITVDNFVYNGVTYVPLRAISENLSCTVGWDQNTKTATITSKTPSQSGSNSGSNSALTKEIENLYNYNLFKGAAETILSSSDLAMSLYLNNLSSISNISAVETSFDRGKSLLDATKESFVNPSPILIYLVEKFEAKLGASKINLSVYKSSRKTDYDAQMAWDVEQQINWDSYQMLSMDINPVMYEGLRNALSLSN